MNTSDLLSDVLKINYITKQKWESSQIKINYDIETIFDDIDQEERKIVGLLQTPDFNFRSILYEWHEYDGSAYIKDAEYEFFGTNNRFRRFLQSESTKDFFWDLKDLISEIRFLDCYSALQFEIPDDKKISRLELAANVAIDIWLD